MKRKINMDSLCFIWRLNIALKLHVHVCALVSEHCRDMWLSRIYETDIFSNGITVNNTLKDFSGFPSLLVVKSVR